MKNKLWVIISIVLAVCIAAGGIIWSNDAADKTKQIEALTADVADKAGQIETLNTNVADKDKQIETLNANVADKIGQIDALNTNIADKDGQIETLNTNIADKDGQIETLNANVADRDGQIETLTANVADKDGQIETLNTNIADKDGQIEALNANVADRDKQIETLTAVGKEAIDKITAYETEIAGKNAEIADKNAELELLRGAAAEQAEKIKTLASDVTANIAEINTLTVSEAKTQADTLTADIRTTVEQVLALIAEPEAAEEPALAPSAAIAQAVAEITGTAVPDTAEAEAADNAAAEKAEQVKTLLAAIITGTEQLDTLSTGMQDTSAQIAEKAAAVMDSAAGIIAANEEKLLLSVNGEKIYESDLTSYVNDIVAYYGQNGYTIDTADEEIMKTVRALALTTAIQYTLLNQKAEETGIADEVRNGESAANAKADWDRVVNEIAAGLFGITDETPEEEKAAALEQAAEYIGAVYGYTEELFISEAVDNEILVRVEQTMTGDIEVTDDEVKAAYDNAVAADKAQYEGNVSMYEIYSMYYGQESLYVPEGYRGITHILLKVDDALLSDYMAKKDTFEAQQTAEPAAEATEEAAEETAEAATEETAEAAAEPVTEEQVAAAKQAVLDSVKETVDEIKAKFEAGTSFEDLIAEYGTDPGMQDPATLANGYSVHQDSIMWDPAFTEGAMALEKVGDMGEPVVGSYGVHILYYLRDVPAGAVEMTEEKAAAIRAELLNTKQRRR